ncbi:MAG: hypothetical protein AAFO69_06360, partial [Bacteroidota bacterium]
MENLNYNLTLEMASQDEKAEFIRKTYLHVALAVLSFVLLELIFFQTGIALAISEVMLSGTYTWLIV